jgi:hypothetical protein
MMLAVDYQEALPEAGATPFSIVPRQAEVEYAGLVQEFEATAQALLGLVDKAIDDGYFDPEIVSSEEWREEAVFLARQLRRLPWLLVHLECPAKYATLKRLYFEWAKACGQLAISLHSLATEEGAWPTMVRVCFADEEFAAVTAHTVARMIYLESL